MKEINLPSGNYLFISIFKGATNFSIIKDNHFGNRIYYDNNKDDESFEFNCKYVEIPNNQYKIISTTNDITEEQCESIVEKYTNYETEREQLLDGMYEDYLQKGNYWVHDSSGIKLWAFKTAKESLQSLIQSVGLDLKLNYLIIKKL